MIPKDIAKASVKFLPKIHFGSKDDCWEWRGALSKKGYGRMTYYEKPIILAVPAHRFAYSYFVGPIPNGVQVLHHCDNPRCVNPQHLFLGTNADNVKDKIAKGRQIRGSKIGRAKLTEDEIPIIRARVASGETRRSIAKTYGMWHSAINAIVSGQTWKHVA